MNVKNILKKLNLVRYISVFFYIFKVFPIKNNKIVCMNFNGKGFGDSPKYIVKQLLKTEEKLDIVWITKDTKDIPSAVRIVEPETIRFIFEMATAKFWISNSRLPIYIRKRKKQYYIQTWHSPLRIKKIELDAKENLDENYINIIKNDSRLIDMMICGCDFSYDIYKRAFGYSGVIEKIGTPRCDCFFSELDIEAQKEKLKKEYDINFDKKVILYAPTFRNKTNEENVLLNINYFKEKLGDDYIVILKFHPNSKISPELFNINGVFNLTSYPDIQELLSVSDVLITDYSSCCFDMMIANKPCILFVKDYDEYLKKERGIYFKLEELPFIKVKEEDELINILLKNDYNEYYKNIELFKEKIDLYETGQASKKIAEKIMKNIKEDA